MPMPPDSDPPRAPGPHASCAARARTIARTPARCWSRSRTAARSRSAARPTIRPPRGALCTKVARYLERTYSDQRVLHPMRRVGRKGEGRFERISLGRGARRRSPQRFGAIAASADGPQAILPYSYAGTMGLLQYGSMDRRFFHRLGASLLDRTICATAGKAGWARDDRRVDRHGRRAVREQPADPDLGQQSDHVQPALLDARAGSEAPRREADRDRSLPQRHRGEVPRAHRAACRAPTPRSRSA